jgi:hypothetical protein
MAAAAAAETPIDGARTRHPAQRARPVQYHPNRRLHPTLTAQFHEEDLPGLQRAHDHRVTLEHRVQCCHDCHTPIQHGELGMVVVMLPASASDVLDAVETAPLPVIWTMISCKQNTVIGKPCLFV